MKIKISGTTNKKLQLVKYIKDVTGFGLKDSKDLVDLFFETKNPIIVDSHLNNSNEALELFHKADFEKTIDIKITSSDIINGWGDNTVDITESNTEYDKFLELFNFLYKNDKNNLKELMNSELEKLKNELSNLEL